MTTHVPESLRDVAALQAGVVATQQALGAGLSKATLTWQLATGRWQQLQRGTYALFSGPASREAVLWAAVLRVGEDAMLSHHTAAELAQLIDRPSGAVHLTVPCERRVRPIQGLVIHRSIYAERMRHPSLLPPRTRVEETVLDLIGASGTFDDARYRVVAELDGRLAHPGDTRWRDIRRDNAAAADGLITLRYGWADVTANSCRTASELARVLVRRGWDGMPKLCSAGCGVVSGWT